MMSLEDLEIANDMEITKMVAIHCGWKNGYIDEWTETMFADSPEGYSSKPVPNFCHDLNAMHKAEMKLYELPDGVAQKYISLLPEACEGGWVLKLEQCTFASAKERAITFIRTMEWHNDRMKGK